MKKTLIETIEVGAGGASSIEFTSIPQDGVDLLIKISSRSALGLTYGYFYVYPNADTTSGNYVYKTLRGFDGTVAGTNDPPIYQAGNSQTANTFGNVEVYLPNYTSSTTKTMSADAGNSGNVNYPRYAIYAINWTGTAAITSLRLTSVGNFMQYSTASLYKISA